MHRYRTHNCNDLSITDVGSTARLSGWIHRRRDHGQLVFLDLRDHFGITQPGESWQAIEAGTTQMTGQLPINASGGLIGLGHPVGATGVRMLLDSAKQVSGKAGGYQFRLLADYQQVSVQTYNP